MWPAQPWQRIHIDFAGPFLGSNFLVVVDTHSKWPEVVEMKTLTSAKTIEALRELFATYGLLQQLVSDNGSQFTSEEFAQFMTTNGIKHICCAPYHPASNGLAVRFVQTFKKSIEQSRSDELREPSKSTELGREIATRSDVPKLASRGSDSEDHQQHTTQPEGVRRYPKREHRPPKGY